MYSVVYGKENCPRLHLRAHKLTYDVSPSKPRSIMQRWMKLSAAYSESPLRVGCLEWPLRVSPSHALQLQATAALRALHPVKSRHAQVHVQYQQY